MLALHLMPHRSVGHDVVAVPTTLSVARQAACCFEIFHDPLHGALGDSDLIGKIAQPQLRVTSKADQHVAVVGEERPTPLVDVLNRRNVANDGSRSHADMLGTSLPELNFR